MAYDPKAANKWTARIIPLILLGLIGYAAWVVTKLVCVDHLLRTKGSQSAVLHPRTGPAIVVLVLFYILLLPVLICYGRLIQTIVTNPGYTPRGPLYTSRAAQKTESVDGHRTGHRHRHHRHHPHHHHQLHQIVPVEKAIKPHPAPSHESFVSAAKTEFDDGQNFWRKDTFICNFDGRPNWCSKCMNFKTDRTHHCRETDRCVRKMDHFCPWVGGIISETSFKYFIQFTTYAALFCTHVLVTMAVLVAERRREKDNPNIHWCIVLGLSALFLLFSSGMSMSSLQLAFINSTTVENLSRKTKVWFVAVLIPRPHDERSHGEGQKFMTITYPRPPEEQHMLQQQYDSSFSGKSLPSNGNLTNQEQQERQNGTRSALCPSHPPRQRPLSRDTSAFSNDLLPSSSPQRHVVPYTEPRTFAILQSLPGQTPFDLGPLDNLKEVLGYAYIDWFLPLKPSPCTDHTSHVSAVRMGEAVDEMKRSAGLFTEKSHRRRRRKRRKLETEDGEAHQASNGAYATRHDKKAQQRNKA